MAENGISHGDVQSLNIIKGKGKDGKWWLIDFGFGIFIDLVEDDYESQLHKYMEQYKIHNFVGNILYLSPALFWLNEHMWHWDYGNEADKKKMSKQDVINLFKSANSWSLEAAVIDAKNHFNLTVEVETAKKLITDTWARANTEKYNFFLSIIRDKYSSMVAIWDYWKEEGLRAVRLGTKFRELQHAKKQDDPWKYKTTETG